uniref:Late blight resistance protein n=1 Tax=Solanum tuberosum TaxID=4113 RepID=M1DNM2_SOLTU
MHELNRAKVGVPLYYFQARRYPGSASSTSLIQLSTPESVVSAELRKPGQGFAWGPAMVFECRPRPGCRLGA